jgi:hypothetical protein
MSEAQAKVKLLALVSDCELARAELEDLTARQNEARKTYLRLAEKRFYEEITTIEGGVPWDKLCWPSSSHYNDNKREDMRCIGCRKFIETGRVSVWNGSLKGSGLSFGPVPKPDVFAHEACVPQSIRDMMSLD